MTHNTAGPASYRKWSAYRRRLAGIDVTLTQLSVYASEGKELEEYEPDDDDLGEN